LAVAFIYPGQGSQSVGMGRRLAAASSQAAAVWEQADAALGESISRLAWEGPAEQLDLTVNAQPALLAASVAAGAALDVALAEAGEERPFGAPSHHAGHSMGQYSAMVAAGVVELDDALRLVRERGRLMQASSGDGAMAAIIGLDEAHIDDLVAAGSGAGILTVANRNSPGQIVISGERAAVEAAVGAAKGLGARRAMVLPVSVAAHSSLMADAAAGMRTALAEVTFSDPREPLLANADASLLTTADACRGELIDHLTRGVDWVDAVLALTTSSNDIFVEVGPGKVLSGLVRRIASDATTIATDDITTDDGIDLPSIKPVQE
jgi:[acyl-carrier-protein] S-malonyltransferase